MSKSLFPGLTPELQVGFHFRLKTIKDLYFHEALSNTVKKLIIRDIDDELAKYISNESLQKLASYSIRGEAVFPLPIILKENPFLLGYYRLLLGFSQKEFYTKGPFGRFRLMEDKGEISKAAIKEVEDLCLSLIESSEYFVKEISDISLPLISDLQLLTVGPQLRGSMNVKYGQIATEKTFSIIKDIVKDYIIASTPTSIDIKNDSGRLVKIAFAADPDIEITEQLSSTNRGLISIEIKGGRDYSNIHNRIGEAEKSHQKAKKRGHREFMTILSVDIDYKVLKEESPTTNHFFQIDKIFDKSNDEFVSFKDILSSILSIRI